MPNENAILGVLANAHMFRRMHVSGMSRTHGQRKMRSGMCGNAGSSTHSTAVTEFSVCVENTLPSVCTAIAHTWGKEGKHATPDTRTRISQACQLVSVCLLPEALQ